MSFGVRPSSGVNASKNLVGNQPTKSITKFFCVSYDVNYLSNKSLNLIINIGAGTHMGGLWLGKIIFPSDVWALGFEPRLVQNSIEACCKIHYDSNKNFVPRNLK